ncbi:MAG: vancomycin resistance protein [Myxococcales bacterium]|nr:vancomycin resistance protein [Myxococcales bacterium]
MWRGVDPPRYPLGAVKRSTSIALPLALGVALGLSALVSLSPVVPRRPLVLGLRVGARVAPEGGLDTWLAERDERLRATAIVLRARGQRLETTLGQLGVALDLPRTADASRAIGHTGSLLRRVREARRAGRGEVDVPLSVRVDNALAAGVLEAFRLAVEVAPVDASLDLRQHARIHDQPGVALDLGASLALIRAVVHSAPGPAHGVDVGLLREATIPDELELVTRAVPARVSSKDLEFIAVEKVLAIFETKYQVHKVGRSVNVELAAKKLDGLVLVPDGVMSFNDRVGPRTRAAGFQEAPEIQGDELTIGIGGGTCQVSSTLFAAAVHGGLEVIERKAHTRPSDYTRLGLDATVAYGAVDLKLKNPYPFAIAVHAFNPAPGSLRVELLGGERVKSVKYGYGISNIEPFLRRIVEKSFMTAGRTLRKQKGTRGMSVHSTVFVAYVDGTTARRQFYSGYRATPEIFWVAPGSDRATLPPLPEHSRGVEGEPGLAADDGEHAVP